MNDTKECSRQFQQGYYNIPLLAIERDFDYLAWSQTMKTNWVWFIAVAIVYLALIRVGQRFMHTRVAYDLRTILFLWNLSLAVFSIFASYRLIPEFVYMIRDFGFASTMCDFGSLEHRQSIGIWVFFFIISKWIELGDTAFIVLRKRRLIFLHWYHHISVMIYVAYSTAHLPAMSYPFMTLNYIVHSLMYSYFTLKSLQLKIPRAVSIMVTMLQLMQMVAGIYITAFVYFSRAKGRSCCAPNEAIVAAMVMYGSYFVLFLKFFVDVYWRKISITEYTSKKID